MTVTCKDLNRRLGQLKSERTSYLDHWRDLSDYVSPRTSRFLATDRLKQGYTRNSKILDNTATLGLRTLASGMMSGITSPARPWFQLRTGNTQLDQFLPVKEWLDLAKRRMLEIFLKSNLYTVLPQMYSDLGLYGTAAFAVLEDEETFIRCMGFPIGSYALGASSRGVVNACFREYQMTVGQLVEQFGKEQCSISVQNMHTNRNLDSWINVVHAVEPNPDADERKLESKFKKFRSIYYETSAHDSEFLSDKGFDEFPIIAPRWQTIGEDIYGISPGMEALSDVKSLQIEQKRKLQGIDKMVTPPMVAPTALKNKRASVLSGDVTYLDTQNGGQGFTPAYQVNLRLGELMQDIQETQGRINAAFFKDLFMMISDIERTGVTAFEIARKEEEKLLALGPVYIKLNDEMLDPLIDRSFAIMLRSGQLPPPPPELHGVALSVEYISVMAQTMKAIGVTGIERVMTFAGNMAQAFPGILDKINGDVAVSEYADMIGTPPQLINDDETVAKVRAQRAQQQQAQQAAAMANQGADTAQKLANAPLSDNNALSQLMQRMRGAAPAPQGAA